MAQLAEQASQCDVPEELEIPAALLGTYLGLAGSEKPFQA
jgi:hypothetical protein